MTETDPEVPDPEVPDPEPEPEVPVPEPDPDERDPYEKPDPVIIKCPTPRCVNYNAEIIVGVHYQDEETGLWIEVDGITCGGCGADITDTAVPLGPPLDPDPSP